MLSARVAIRRSLIANRLVRLNTTQAAPAEEPELDIQTNLFQPDPEAAEKFVKTEANVEKHAAHTTNTWKKISLFVCVPALLATAMSTYFLEKKHHEHAAAHPRPSEDELPPEYEFQNVRSTKFFWGDGDKTVFWNDKVNFHKKE